jgi:hypothetical protein
MQQQVRSATTGNAPNATSAESAAEESSRAESTVYTSNADQQSALTETTTDTESTWLLDEAADAQDALPPNFTTIMATLREAIYARASRVGDLSNYGSLRAKAGEQIAAATYSAVHDAVNGACVPVTTEQAKRKATWEPETAAVYRELYSELLPPAKQRFVVACLALSGSGRALVAEQAKGWIADLHFEICDPDVAQQLFSIKKALSPEQETEIWKRLMNAAKPDVIARAR